MFNDIFDDLWAKYYAPKLSKREVKQFANACRRPPSDLLEKIIKPQAYVPDKSSYLSLSQSAENVGRAHFEARGLIASVDPLDWVVPQFFTNSLRVFRLAKMTPFSGISASKNDPLSLRL